MKHTIWSNMNLDLNDWREDLLAEEPDLTESELYDRMVELNDSYLDDECMNLGDIHYNAPILVIADLGMWDGRKSAYKEIESGKVSDCLTTDCDFSEFFVDEQGDLRCDAVHHDGTNHYLYRAYKDGISPSQAENLKWKIYTGKATRADITRITKRLGDDIAKVYGWELPPRRGRRAGTVGKKNSGKRMIQFILNAKTIEDCEDVCLQLCNLCGFGKSFSDGMQQGDVTLAEQCVIKAFNIWNVPYARKEPFAPANACYIAKVEEGRAG